MRFRQLEYARLGAWSASGSSREMINSRDELIISPASLSRNQRDHQFNPRNDQLAARPDGFADEIVRNAARSSIHAAT